MSTIDMSFADLPVAVQARNSGRSLWATFNAAVLLACAAGLRFACLQVADGERAIFWFLALFAWRYIRFVVNCIGWLCYRPALAPSASRQKLSSKDVTVILPTIDPLGSDFGECVRTCAENSPAAILVVTAGDELLANTQGAIAPFQKQFPSVAFSVSRTQVASKREQVAHAIPLVKTPLTVMLDDHVFWGPRFLLSLLCPFEDDSVGIVGTNKKVRRVPGLSTWGRMWNILGALYLIRHNFEVRASNAIDGGVFVVSARSCAIRTEIIQSPQFMAGYKNELFFLGTFGPLNADDDNYLTRFVVRQGWRVKIQYTADACIETTVGVAAPVAKKFLGQCRRWARTTWRSNSCSLFTDRSVWAFQPYCVYAVFLTSFTNFAFATDFGLFGLLLCSSWANATVYGIGAPWVLALWILFTKLVKVSPYFWQYPRDIPFFFGYVMFAWAHSFIKFWALLTFWDCQWSGRNLGAIKVGHDGKDDHPKDATKDTKDTKEAPKDIRDTKTARKNTPIRRNKDVALSVSGRVSIIRSNVKTKIRSTLECADEVDGIIAQLSDLKQGAEAYVRSQQALGDRVAKALSLASAIKAEAPPAEGVTAKLLDLKSSVIAICDKFDVMGNENQRRASVSSESRPRLTEESLRALQGADPKLPRSYSHASMATLIKETQEDCGGTSGLSDKKSPKKYPGTSTPAKASGSKTTPLRSTPLSLPRPFPAILQDSSASGSEPDKEWEKKHDAIFAPDTTAFDFSDRTLTASGSRKQSASGPSTAKKLPSIARRSVSAAADAKSVETTPTPSPRRDSRPAPPNPDFECW